MSWLSNKISWLIAIVGICAILSCECTLNGANGQLILEDSYNSRNDSLFGLYRNLVSIPSVSGTEHEIAIFLRDHLEAQGLTVELQPVKSTAKHSKPAPRFNVFAYVPGHRQTRALLTSHIDTVPPFIPFSQQNDVIWGRGSVDAKPCVAAQIIAFKQLLGKKLIAPEDASLLFVVGEEVSGDGMFTANSLGVSWETVIFGEPTERKLVSGHKGLIVFHVSSKGESGHSGYPWLGKNAIDPLLEALVGVQNLLLPSSQKYGNSTVNIGKFVGGVEANVIPDNAVAAVGVRLANGDADSVKGLLLKTIHDVDPSLNVTFFKNMYGPVDIDHDVPGFEVTTVNYGTDVPNLRGTHRRFLYGPGSILDAHSDHEHLKIEDLYHAMAGYQKILLHALSVERDR